MLITEYLEYLVKLIAEYSKTGLIISTDIKSDNRSHKIGLIKAKIVFQDESKLLVTEYIDLRYKVEKLSYSFHYQDKEGNMRFRYDNAKHKPALNFDNHKHCEDRIEESETPELRDVLDEIIDDFLGDISKGIECG